jgi:hypothetical protein
MKEINPAIKNIARRQTREQEYREKMKSHISGQEDYKPFCKKSQSKR